MLIRISHKKGLRNIFGRCPGITSQLHMVLIYDHFFHSTMFPDLTQISELVQIEIDILILILQTKFDNVPTKIYVPPEHKHHNFIFINRSRLY